MKNIVDYCLLKLSVDDNSVLTTGKVETFIKDYLVIKVKYSENININTEVYINIFHEGKGVFKYKGKIEGVENNLVSLKEVKQLVESERRSKKRIIVKIPLKVNTIKNKKDEVIELNKPILMVGRNLSIDGVLLESELDIPEEVSFVVYLPIEKSNVYLETITRRKYQKDNSFFYGCKFEIKDKNKNDLLKNFILKNYNNKILKYYN